MESSIIVMGSIFVCAVVVWVTIAICEKKWLPDSVSEWLSVKTLTYGKPLEERYRVDIVVQEVDRAFREAWEWEAQVSVPNTPTVLRNTGRTYISPEQGYKQAKRAARRLILDHNRGEQTIEKTIYM